LAVRSAGKFALVTDRSSRMITLNQREIVTEAVRTLGDQARASPT